MKITKDLSPTICPLPFLTTYITADGSRVACCESQEFKLGDATEPFRTTWNNENYRQLREALIQGKRPELCVKCWENEDLGISSNRQDKWKDYELGFFGSSLPQVTEDLTVENLPVAVELKCNNLCNLKCRMCHPESSFRIKEDREIIDKYRKAMPWSQKVLSSQSTVQSLIGEGANFFDQLELVQFSGGEPLISEEQASLVRTLLKNSPERLHLRYSTNLTQLNYQDIDYPDLWKHFGKVNVKISVDGVDDVYDYIRIGATFKKVADNIQRLMDFNLPNLTIAFGFTTQAYNVFQLPEFLDYFEKLVHPEAITKHLLYAPRMMMIGSLSRPYRERIAKKLDAQRPELQSITHVLRAEEGDAKHWDTLNAYTSEMEAKYQVTRGFRYLMDKYLEGY